MKQPPTPPTGISRFALSRVAIATLACGVISVACLSEEQGIAADPKGTGEAGAPESGSPADPTAGTTATGGSASGGSPTSTGGDPGSPHGPHGGAPHEPPTGTAGALDPGGAPAEGGMGGSAEPPTPMSCLFHTDAPPPVDAAGGAAPTPPPADVVIQQNPFLGAYLTDAAGRTLYTYGADLPGDCESAPVSRCEADCLVSWPPFTGGQRVLGAGLDDAVFGTIMRADGSSQATYYGWPLYYYKTDLALGQLTGQGKAKTWHAADLTPPSVVIMKAGTVKYLADGTGRTLYVAGSDVPGGDEDPVSNCADACLDSFRPFHDKNVSVVSSLEPTDFVVFVRKGKGGLQLAYKGMPLYLSLADAHAGDMHGVETAGFTAALP